MRISVRLYGILQDYRPPGSNGRLIELELEDGLSVRALAERMGIPIDTVYLAFLDEHQVPLDTPLGEGVNVKLFPPAAGGLSH